MLFHQVLSCQDKIVKIFNNGSKVSSKYNTYFKKKLLLTKHSIFVSFHRIGLKHKYAC